MATVDGGETVIYNKIFGRINDQHGGEPARIIQGVARIAAEHGFIAGYDEGKRRLHEIDGYKGYKTIDDALAKACLSAHMRKPFTGVSR
jgi:hypothetical protein